MRKLIAAALVLLGLAPAAAQVPSFPQTLPANTVVGRLGIGPGPSQAIPFATLTSNLFTSLCTTSGAFPIYNATAGGWRCSTAGGAGSLATLNGGPLTINPTAGLTGTAVNQGILTNQSATGAPTGVAAFNRFNITDGLDASGADAVESFGLYIAHTTTATKKGSTGAVFAHLFVGADAAVSASNRDFIGIQSQVNSSATMPVTATAAAMFAFAGQAIAESGSSGFDGVVGAEIGVGSNQAGAVQNIVGWDIVNNGSAQAAVAAVGYRLRANSTGRFNVGFQLINQPIATTGTIFATSGAHTVANGFDISSYTISGAALKTAKANIDGPTGFMNIGASSTASFALHLTMAAGANTGLGITDASTSFSGGVYSTLGTSLSVGTLSNHPLSLLANNTIGISISTAAVVRFNTGYGTGIIHSGATGILSSSLVVSADLNITTTSCTNQVVTAISAGGVGTCSNTPLTSANFANPSASVGLAAVNGTATTAMRSDGAPALSQAIVPTWTGVHTHTVTQAANTSADGIVLDDATAATSGNQQFSPLFRWRGRGWKTDATAASQPVDWGAEVQPVQGAANPSSIFVLKSQVNNGGYSTKFFISAGATDTTIGFEGSGSAQLNFRVSGSTVGLHYADAGQYIFGAATAVPVLMYTSNTERLRIMPTSNHLAPAGTAPALTSCGGGSPTIVGTDVAGIVTMGTTATGCVITFNVTYAAEPHCIVSWIATPLASQSYATSTTAITLTQTSASGNVVKYHCLARQSGFLLKRDFDPAANDNAPMWVNKVA